MTSVSLSVVPSGWSTVRLNFRPDGTARTGETMSRAATSAAKMLRRMVILLLQSKLEDAVGMPDNGKSPVGDTLGSAEVVVAEALVGDGRDDRVVVDEAAEDRQQGGRGAGGRVRGVEGVDVRDEHGRGRSEWHAAH